MFIHLSTGRVQYCEHHTQICTLTHTRTHTHTRMICDLIYIHIHICTYIHTYEHMYIHLPINRSCAVLQASHTNMCAHTHAHTHTHTHARAHTQTHTHTDDTYVLYMYIYICIFDICTQYIRTFVYPSAHEQVWHSGPQYCTRPVDGQMDIHVFVCMYVCTYMYMYVYQITYHPCVCVCISICPRTGLVKYCGPECQSSHWAAHEKEHVEILARTSKLQVSRSSPPMPSLYM